MLIVEEYINSGWFVGCWLLVELRKRKEKKRKKKKVESTAESLLVGGTAAFVFRQNPFVDGDRAKE